MTYNQFICECVLRLGTVIEPERQRSAWTPSACLSRAVALADNLMENGFISLPLELLREKLGLYQAALQTAYQARTKETDKEFFGSETTSRIDGPKLMKMAGSIESFIEAKNHLYAFANLSLPELIEQARNYEDRMRGANQSISPAAESILRHFENKVFENEEEEQEQALLKNLEQHKDDRLDAFGFHARQIRDALIGTKVAQRSFMERLGPAWKTARGAKVNKPSKSHSRAKKSASQDGKI
jgi:hypothetical protein